MAGNPSAPIVVATTPAEDTAAAVADPNWKVPRTSWGHPNLEGVYSTDDMRSVPRDLIQTIAFVRVLGESLLRPEGKDQDQEWGTETDIRHDAAAMKTFQR